MKSRSTQSNCPREQRAHTLVGAALLVAVAAVVVAHVGAGSGAVDVPAGAGPNPPRAPGLSAEIAAAPHEEQHPIGTSHLAEASPAQPAPIPLVRELAPAPVELDPTLAAELNQRVERAISDALARGKGRFGRGDLAVAARVVHASSKVVVYERESARLLAPASNMKLITGLSALVLLPIDGTFATRVEARQLPRDGRLEGPLVVRASGDPFYRHGDPQFGLLQLDRLAAALRSAGVAHVQGGLVLDSGAFPEPGPAPGWPRPEGDWTASYALAGGFQLHGGLLHLSVAAGKPGTRAAARLAPAPTGLSERLEVDTLASSPPNVRIGVVDARRSVSVTGEIGQVYSDFQREFRHPAPQEGFAAALVASLQRAGVRVDGGVRFERGMPPGVELARVESPWKDLLDPIHRHSVNGVADSLWFHLGAEVEGDPSRAGSARAVARALSRLGVDATGLVQVDGSGLSRDNRASPIHLCELMLAALARPEDERALFLDSLAASDEPGTLAGRLGRGPAAGRVRAKTGFLRGASALSGVLTTLKGESLVFSIVVSYPPLDGYNDACWKPMQDDLLHRLARWEPTGSLERGAEAGARSRSEP